MSGFYNQRQYSGSIAKRPRLGPRGPHLVPGNPHAEDDGKRLMSFKEFILSQSNDINEQEALARYTDYKTEFTRRQIDKFFKEHQEEEWFRTKYRPTELKKIEEWVKQSIEKRKEIYKQMLEKQLIGELSVDYENNQSLSQFLTNFSLALEGATLDEIENGEASKNHSVSSIFIPNVHPTIDKSTIEEYAATHAGFLRVALSDAQPDKGFKRRAWITYKYMDADSLRKLCWEFNAHKFNGQEIKAIVNKEMNNRIRYTQFWFCHADSTKSDLKNVAKLLTHFEGEECTLLESIKEHLIEETNEEEQVLGVSDQVSPPFEMSQDPKLMKTLDSIILYLRVVYSFDYYAATKYTGEDDMPERLGIMFARPSPPSTFGTESPREVLRQFIDAQRARIDLFLEKPSLSEAEQKQLGRRNAEEEVESFIYQHTFEKKPGEKYVCKLTKKRFTAPEFVRKHIFNRCGDKLDEVRTDVEFFNNYVADPNRPM